MNATAVDHILLCFIQYCIYTDDGLSNKTETFEMFAFFVVIYFCIKLGSHSVHSLPITETLSTKIKARPYRTSCTLSKFNLYQIFSSQRAFSWPLSFLRIAVS